jgi:hypothetical protein
LLELAPQPSGGLDVSGVGDGEAAGPYPGMVGDQPGVKVGPDPVEIGVNVDYPADRGRVD